MRIIQNIVTLSIVCVSIFPLAIRDSNAMTVDEIVSKWDAAVRSTQPVIEDISCCVSWTSTYVDPQKGGAKVTQQGKSSFLYDSEALRFHRVLKSYAIDKNEHMVPGGIDFQLLTQNTLSVSNASASYRYSRHEGPGDELGHLVISSAENETLDDKFRQHGDIYGFFVPEKKDVAKFYASHPEITLEIVSESEMLDDIRAIHLKETRTNGSTIERWLDPEISFATLRYVGTDENGRPHRVIDYSEYDGVRLPRRLTQKTYDAEGAVSLDMMLEVSGLAVNQSPPPELLTLEGMGIPKGASVWDSRTNQHYEYE